MRCLNKLFLAACFFGLGVAHLYGNEPEGKTIFQQEIEENDEDALLDFINGKRYIPLAGKSENLTISGEVHFEWNYQKERLMGKDLRVYTFREFEEWTDEIFEPRDRIMIGHNDFDVQLDFFMDWKGEHTWARSHLRYDNSAGVSDNGLDELIDPEGYHGSGSVDNLALREAYMGYEIFNCRDNRMTVELGRRGQLYKVFYSEIAYSSRLDGIILKFASKNGANLVEDWYITGAAFVVDERCNHFAWATEFGLNNILDSGVDFKYSYVDWHKRGKNRYFVKNPLGFRFKVSQWSLFYEFSPNWLGGYPIALSGGFLMNHIPAKYVYINTAGPVNYTPLKKKIGNQNLGGFVNIQFNEIEHEGDWYASALVGFCQAQAIPDNDVRNIGTGNFLHESMTAFGRGNTNWKGYCLRAGYAMTDNWVIETQYNHSWNIKNIAGTRSYMRYTMESIYSF